MVKFSIAFFSLLITEGSSVDLLQSSNPHHYTLSSEISQDNKENNKPLQSNDGFAKYVSASDRREKKDLSGLFQIIKYFNPYPYDSMVENICSVFPFFGWTPNRCSTNVKLSVSNFTIQYDLYLKDFDYLVDVPDLRSAFEYVMKQVLNENTWGTDTFFYSFYVEEDAISNLQNRRKAISNRVNRRTVTAKGVCKTKHCSVPSSYDFPSKKYNNTRFLEENDPFARLRDFPHVLPFLQYKLERYREKKSVTYDANFEMMTEYPWTNFSEVSIEQIADSMASTSTSICQVSEEQCIIQRIVVSSVLSKLDINYNESSSECLWEGVLCNDSHIIIGLRIEKSSQSTMNYFPIEVLQLPSLSSLHLVNTGLVGTIPNMSNLTEIKKIILEKNMLTGSIPSEIGLLVNMESISLGNNNLVGGIPSQLGNLEKLTLLDIGYNTNLGQSIPSHLGKLKHLEVLKLNDCDLTSTLPKSFGALNEIEMIILSNNKLEGSINLLSNLTKLSVLQLDNNRLTGTISDSFQNLNDLVIFSLYNNLLTGPFLNALGGLPHLTDLILGKNEITGSISSDIGALVNIKNFDVANCNITKELPSEIGHLEKLQVLNVVGNFVSGTIPTEFGGLSAVETLVLSGNLFTGPIPSELGQLSSLEVIDLGNNALTGPIPTELNKLKNLEDIFVAGNDFTGDISFLCDSDYFTFDSEDFPDVDCSANEGDAMIELYEALGLRRYGRNRASKCEWTGIQCNSKGSIIGIELGGKELGGKLSSVIGKIHNLEMLDLGNNALQGTIPEEISNLRFLKSVVLDDNNFTGDAFFLCGVSFEVSVDEGEVALCTAQPTLAPSTAKPTLASSSPTSSQIPSISPTSMIWDQLGSDVEGDENYEEYGTVVALSRKGDRLWAAGKNKTKYYLFDGGGFDPTSKLVSYTNEGECGPRGDDAIADSAVCGGTMYKVHEVPFVSGQIAVTINGCNYYAYTIYNCHSSNRWVFEHDFTSEFSARIDSIQVSADGNTFIAGQKDYASKGAASVFEYDGSSWRKKGYTIESLEPGSYFGASVDIATDITSDTTVIAIGAPGYGYVKTYQYIFGNWILRDEIRSPASKTDFGISVSMSEDATRIIVGATHFPTNGAVYFYQLYPVKLLHRDDGDGTDARLGRSVSTSADGMVMAAGAYMGQYVRLYKANDSTKQMYTQISTNIADIASKDFGSSVALSSDGTRLAVNAPYSDEGGINAGKTYLYAIHASSYEEIGSALLGEDAGDRWGSSVALSGDGKKMASGATLNNGSGTNQGHVRVYELVGVP